MMLLLQNQTIVYDFRIDNYYNRLNVLDDLTIMTNLYCKYFFCLRENRNKS